MHPDTSIPLRRPVHGFTLVEMLIGMVAASIAALTLGATLHTTFRAWNEGQRAVELQRDASVTMIAVGKAIREASNTVVQVSGNRIFVGNQVFRYRPALGSFIQTPNAGQPQDKITLINGKVTAMTTVLAPTALALHLELEDGSDQIEVDGAWSFRN